MEQIGFIGAGIMGKPMIRNLMKAGFRVNFFVRNRSKAEDLIASGAKYCGTIKECVRGCSKVITMVGFPRDVEEVYFAEGNILDSAERGTYLIDMTTTSPQLSVRIFDEAKKRGLYALDAPVTGGDSGAKAGTLSILAGGEEEDYRACIPVFKAMGTNVNYQGKAGNGQHCKMANQIMISGTLSGVCEAIAYAKAKGLDLDTMYRSVSSGAAGSRQLDTFAPKIFKGDYAPGFFVRHFVKDMKIAAEEAKKSGLDLEVLRLVLSHFEELEEKGFGSFGTQALMKYYE